MLNHLFTKKPKQLLKASRQRYLNHPIINLCDTNLAMCEAWMNVFSMEDGVNIYHGDILHLSSKAIVSPANSFGDMSGGLDKVIDDFYDGRAQPKIGERIRVEFLGEIPVGMATLVDTGTRKTPYIILAPTMRIPGILGPNTIHSYLAMRAILVCIIRSQKQYKIDSISIPGLATGVGVLGFDEAASQMKVAFDQVYNGAWQKIAHPAMAPYANRKS